MDLTRAEVVFHRGGGHGGGINVDGGASESVFGGGMMDFCVDAKVAVYLETSVSLGEENRNADGQEQGDQKHKPIVDDVFVLSACKMGNVLFKKHEDEGEGEENVGQLALDEPCERVYEEEQTENGGDQGNVTENLCKGDLDVDGIQYDQDGGKDEAQAPKDFPSFHFFNLISSILYCKSLK